ncbi:hypothetical protein [uncultured Candidatus Thioglobus sp.]|jgi:hypothetical protein|uniref:TA system antitoxin ParD family protein n=1 Tax=uncultured Candidatus Thioglobus sp. TaxID=655186 RepID=UPI0032B15E1E
MSVSIRVNDELYNLAKTQAKAEFRTIPSQIEYWARIGRTAMANPDLPIEMVEQLLIAVNEESEPFEFSK